MTTDELVVYSEMDLLVMIMSLEARPKDIGSDGVCNRDCMDALISEIQMREYRRLGYVERSN